MGSLIAGDGGWGSRAAQQYRCFRGPGTGTGAVLGAVSGAGSRETQPGLQLECHSATLWCFARSITGRKLIRGSLKPWDRALHLANRCCDSSAHGWDLGVLPEWLFASCFSSAFHSNQRLCLEGFYFLVSNLFWSQQRGIIRRNNINSVVFSLFLFSFFPKEK